MNDFCSIYIKKKNIQKNYPCCLRKRRYTIGRMDSINSRSSSVKQKYDTPKIERYGNLRDLTQSVGTAKASNDSTQGGNNLKTA
jgi:hypothetical protein